MPDMRYWYCDANVFLAYFNSEEGRVETIDTLFAQVTQNAYLKLVTSVLSITEVSHVAAERSRGVLDENIDEQLDLLWNDRSLLEFIDFNEVIARKARNLIRYAISNRLVIKPNDAIHLISAQFVGAGRFFTYDKKLEKFSDFMQFPITPPDVDQPPLPLKYDE
ncbi:MAG: PIN domain-containing protein [Chloroflexi bacterium]|nr:MAG: PIN domain-containing protein [Chloroflexota bacterium]